MFDKTTCTTEKSKKTKKVPKDQKKRYFKKPSFSLFYFLITSLLNVKYVLEFLIESEFTYKTYTFLALSLTFQFSFSFILHSCEIKNQNAISKHKILKYCILTMSSMFQSCFLLIVKCNLEHFEIFHLQTIFWDINAIFLYGLFFFQLFEKKQKILSIFINFVIPLIFFSIKSSEPKEIILNFISFIQNISILLLFQQNFSKNFICNKTNEEDDEKVCEFLAEGILILAKDKCDILFISRGFSSNLSKIKKLQNFEEINKCLQDLEEQKIIIDKAHDQDSIMASFKKKMNTSFSQPKFHTKNVLMNSSKTNKIKYYNLEEVLRTFDTHFDLFREKKVVRSYLFYNSDNEVKELSIKNVSYKNKLAYCLCINRGNQINLLPKLTKENEFQSRLLSSFSHEMRTPLNGSIPLLEEALENLEMEDYDSMKDHVFSALGSLKLLENTINDIIDFQALYSGEFYLNIQELNLKNILDEVIKLMKVKAEAKGLIFASEIDNEIPEHIMSDSNRIKQLLVNLLSNALKFTKKGFIEIQAKAVQKTPASVIEIKIKDTGNGIEEAKLANLKKILTEFPIENTPFLESTGCSFGLILSQNLALALGTEFSGGISVESKVNEGSCFTFEIIDRIDQKDLPDCVTSKWVSMDGNHEKNAEKSSSRPETISRKSIFSNPSPQLKKLRENTYSKIKSEIFPKTLEFEEEADEENFSETPHHYVSEKMIALNSEFHKKTNSKHSVFHHTKISKASIIENSSSDFAFKNSTEIHSKLFQTQNSVIECTCNKILVVDDSIFNIKTMEMLLKKMDLKCDIALDGFDAIDLFKKKFILKTTACGTKCLGYRLIITDYQMPQKDGVETAIELNLIMKEYKIDEVPIICCTAFDSNSLVAKCFHAGMKEVIFKPINLEFLRSVVKKWYKL